MDEKLLRECIREYLNEIEAGLRQLIPGWTLKEHIKKNGVKYYTYKQIKAKNQSMNVNCMVQISRSFGIPPEAFLKKLLEKYKSKSNT